MIKLDSSACRQNGRKVDEPQIQHETCKPANKHKYDIIVVGTGAAGASAAASQVNLDTMLKRSHFMIAHGALTVFQRRAVLALQKLSEH